MYNPSIHHRRSIRLKNYDYAGKGLYFITLCTANRKNIFGKIINGELFLNPFGEIAKEEWAKTPEIRNNTSLGEFIIMPNHMHGIISIDYQIRKTGKDEIGKFHSPSHTIGAIIRGYKGATTKRIHQLIREIKEGGRTGELLFAPINPKKNPDLNKGESLFARKENSALKKEKSKSDRNSGELGEWLFAPTDLISPKKDPSQDTGESLFDRDTGARTGESLFAPTIWQRNYYEHIIKSEKAYRNISNYIINNPSNWEKDKLK
ncbi:transposase [Prolixibacter sp. SD074]|uniref:transposase n=1 Tax=Prolixibacter sp. SD074 TaxID=2652391 RepID=UPI0012823D6C|nr:transposase [Prolixibacter sp. SD074]GET29192.1 hypothetical protein SD074_13940 [Prolixibacter sp. SD074]